MKTKIPRHICSTDALLVVEAHDGQCTFALAGRHAFCVIVWLQARAPAAQTNTPIHSRNQDFCVKFPHAFQFGPVGHICTLYPKLGFWAWHQIWFSIIQIIDEYCCCLLPGGGFFVGSLPLQALVLPWVALASPPPAFGLQPNALWLYTARCNPEKTRIWSLHWSSDAPRDRRGMMHCCKVFLKMF